MSGIQDQILKFISGGQRSQLGVWDRNAQECACPLDHTVGSQLFAVGTELLVNDVFVDRDAKGIVQLVHAVHKGCTVLRRESLIFIGAHTVPLLNHFRDWNG